MYVHRRRQCKPHHYVYHIRLWISGIVIKFRNYKLAQGWFFVTLLILTIIVNIFYYLWDNGYIDSIGNPLITTILSISFGIGLIIKFVRGRYGHGSGFVVALLLTWIGSFIFFLWWNDYIGSESSYDYKISDSGSSSYSSSNSSSSYSSSASSTDSKTYKVYVLRCEPGNKYYVGYSGQLERRLRSHFTGKGARFTRVNKPIEHIDTIDCCDEQEAKKVEKEYTIKYARHYGKRNVGGAGDYSKVR